MSKTEDISVGQRSMVTELESSLDPSNLKISICLSTCQGGRFLQQQLESLRRQETVPCELVIGDDASTDDTVAIIQRFAETAPFPVHLHVNPSRLGFRENFMQTAKRCTGDLIAFCDQDDVWHANKLTRCLQPFADPEVMMVCHDANVVDAEGNKTDGVIVNRKDGVWAPSLRPLNSQYALTMVFRRCLTDHYDLWLKTVDENTSDRTQHAAHDPWFYFLASNLGKVVNVDERLLDYRQHGNNSIGVPDGSINKSIAFRLNYYELREQAVRIRMGVLREFQGRTNPKYREHIERQLPLYQKHLEIYAARVPIYADGGLTRRVTGVVKTLSAGGYAESEFGRRSMVSDFLYGVVRFIPGPRVSKLYATASRLISRRHQTTSPTS